MGIDLGGGTSLTWAGWILCLEVASRNGWHPNAAHQVEAYRELEREEAVMDSMKAMTDVDARNLCAALLRAISLMTEVAEKAGKGGFQVYCISEKTSDVATWLKVRKEAALMIDPSTAEVMTTYGQILDPYGVDSDLPEECEQIGKINFARAPLSDVWVSFDDLETETVEALLERVRATRNYSRASDDIPF